MIDQIFNTFFLTRSFFFFCNLEMVSVVDAILGGVLNQGAKMETSSALKVRL